MFLILLFLISWHVKLFETERKKKSLESMVPSYLYILFLNVWFRTIYVILYSNIQTQALEFHFYGNGYLRGQLYLFLCYYISFQKAWLFGSWVYSQNTCRQIISEEKKHWLLNKSKYKNHYLNISTINFYLFSFTEKLHIS